MYRSLEKNGLLISLVFGVVWLIGSFIVDLFDVSSPVFSNYIILELLSFQLVILAIAFALNKLLILEKMISVHNYVPLSLTVISLSALDYSGSSWKALALCSIFLLILRRLMFLFNQQEGAIPIFEIGLMSGLAFIIDPSLFYLLVGSFVAIMQSKAISWRDVAACVLGFCFPLTIQFSWHFLGDSSFTFSLPKFILDQSILGFHPGNVSSWGIYGIGLLIVLAFNHFRGVSDQLNIKQRVHYKSWIYGAALFLFGTFLTQNAINCKQIVLLTFVFLSPSLQLYLSSLKRAFWKNFLLLICMISCAVLKLG